MPDHKDYQSAMDKVAPSEDWKAATLQKMAAARAQQERPKAAPRLRVAKKVGIPLAAAAAVAMLAVPAALRSGGLSAAGVYIVEVTEQSTADAGLQAGDRIISIDDVIITTMDDVSNYLADKNPGDVVTVSLEREGRMVSAEVTLLENPNAAFRMHQMMP